MWKKGRIASATIVLVEHQYMFDLLDVGGEIVVGEDHALASTGRTGRVRQTTGTLPVSTATCSVSGSLVRRSNIEGTPSTGSIV